VLRTAAPAQRSRQRDPQRTRQQILDAATAAFAEKGLGGARVDAIARQAGTNKRMLYHYFGNKEGLFRAAIERVYAQICVAAEQVDLEGDDPEAAMRELVDFVWTYYRKHPEAITLLNSENLHKARHIRGSAALAALQPPFVATIAGLLQRGAATGRFRSGIDPVQLYISIAGLCYFYLSNHHTLSVFFDRDLMRPATLQARRRHIQDLILDHLKAGT
jgi:AcrR family transcriptional regulator